MEGDALRPAADAADADMLAEGNDSAEAGRVWLELAEHLRQSQGMRLVPGADTLAEDVAEIDRGE